MARSAGITVSAVVVFIGSALTVLFGAVAVLGSLLLNSRLIPNAPPHLGYIVIVEALFACAFGGWGIASGVGLIQTKEWARTSMIVFAAILMLFSLPAALILAFIQLPVPKDPNVPSDFATAVRVVIVLFYGLLAALAGFWLFFFNTRSVKAQFHHKQAVVEATPAHLHAETPSANLGAPIHARPLSITIIGWFLVIGSACGPLSLLYSHAVFRTVPLPLCFFGFFVFGRIAASIFLAWVIMQIIAAIGLLRLRNWARLATIALQCLGVLNMVLLVAVPGNRARFQHMMDSAMASINLQMPQQVSSSFPAWIGMIASLPIFLVILWFLITQKKAFVKDGLASVQAP
jgi:hypothetical protein